MKNKGWLYILQRDPPTYINWGGELCEVFKLGKTNNIDKRTMQNNKGYRTGQDPSKWKVFIHSVMTKNYTDAENKLKEILAMYKYSIPHRSAQEMLVIPKKKDKLHILASAILKVVGKPVIISNENLWKGVGHPYLGKNIYLYSTQKNGCPKLIKGTVNLFKDDKFLCTDNEGDSTEYKLSELEEALDEPILNWNELNLIKIDDQYSIDELADMWRLLGPHSLTRWFKLFKGVNYLDEVGIEEDRKWTEFKIGTWLPCPRDKNDILNDYYKKNCQSDPKKIN